MHAGTLDADQPNLGTAAELMLAFAERTGLTSNAPQRRYLWTDAFAVCNFLGLARATGEARYTTLALGLIDRVHRVLGRYRPDGPADGWLSGLSEEEGAARPTLGGLRIGKKLPERPDGEPFDEVLEWDRDGQYFHYLTRWMHALDQAARATGDARFNLWARELAEVAHRAFTREGRGRMVWKMSTDLSRPLVSSMGQHDPLDGLVTCLQLQSTAVELGTAAAGPSMWPLATGFASMISDQELVTTDPLGLGGLLADAGRVAQLRARGAFSGPALINTLLGAAVEGLPYVRQGELQGTASRRLAFRELGLAIGLHAFAMARWGLASSDRQTRALLLSLAGYEPLARGIEVFWLDPTNRGTRLWTEHQDINDVMLATSLHPDGFVVLSHLP